MTNGRSLLRFIDDPSMALLAPEDAGFSSSEDYLEHEVHSPTDNSEDSVEVKVSTISLSNKRKFPENFTGPLKKRMCLKVKAEIDESHPFRPWSPKPKVVKPEIKVEEPYKPEFSYFRPPSPVQFYQSEPVSLVKRRENGENVKEEEEEESDDFGEVRVPIHPTGQGLSNSETEKMISITNEIFPTLQGVRSTKKSHQESQQQRREQRNYKNMTRERRIEANARERTRVHTISAAFDTLRRSIPSYSHNQKLSKLSVLRIACSYIMTLSSIVNEDAPTEGDEPSTSECVDMVSRTIQREGKLRKKKDDND